MALTAGSIVAADIASDAVTTVKILDANVTNAKIASGVDAAKLTTGTLPIARIADAAVTSAKLSQPYTLATAQASTSGTSIDFTGIPSWAKRITVMFDGVSTNGTSNWLLRLGDAGGFETSGYIGVSGVLVTSGFGSSSSAAGFLLTGTGPEQAAVYSGTSVVNLVGGNSWTHFGCLGSTTADRSFCNSGSKTLSDTLTQVRITTVNGTDTFDAGTVNIAYEG